MVLGAVSGTHLAGSEALFSPEALPITRPRSNTSGSGLGLATVKQIVKQIVERHGGRIELGSNLPAGLRVIVRLPVQGLDYSNGPRVNSR